MYFESYDSSWVAHDLWVWSSVEANLGLVCASAPALHSLYKYSTRTPVSSTNVSSSKRSYRRRAPANASLFTDSDMTDTDKQLASMNSSSGSARDPLASVNDPLQTFDHAEVVLPCDSRRPPRILLGKRAKDEENGLKTLLGKVGRTEEQLEREREPDEEKGLRTFMAADV